MRLKDISVLLVEDDADNLELLGACFEEEGALIYCASSIAGALAVTVDKRVDVVVSDLELADGDGCVLLRQLTTRLERKLPAIAVTGYSQQHWRDKAADCGFARYAVKPFALDELVHWITELTGASSRSAGSVES